MASLKFTYRFPRSLVNEGDRLNINFQDMEALLNASFLQESYTSLTASDVNGPDGKGLILLVRDSTNGGTALVLYEDGETPVIVSEITGGGTTFVNGAPGATEIQVKSRSGGVAFRSGSSRNSAVLKTVTLIAEA